MTIRCETNGTYTVIYSKRHPVTGQPRNLRRVNIQSKNAAIRIEKEIVAQLERTLHEARSPKWQIVTEEFLSECKNRGFSRKTIEDYTVGLHAYALPYFGERPIDSITTIEIRQILTENLKERAPATRKNAAKFMRAVFKFGLEAGYLQRNPMPTLKFKSGDKIARCLTEAEVKRFLELARSVGDQWYPHWMLALHTGMRSGELYALTWDKVDLENRILKVDASWNSKDGFKSTKSGNDRLLEIPRTLVSYLSELKLVTGASRFVLPRSIEWDRGRQAIHLRRFLGGIGLPQIRFHDLRATWATILLSKGVEPIKVMKAGGWNDMKTMMIYVRKAGVDIRGMSDCLNDLHDPHSPRGKVLQLLPGS